MSRILRYKHLEFNCKEYDTNATSFHVHAMQQVKHTEHILKTNLLNKRSNVIKNKFWIINSKSEKQMIMKFHLIVTKNRYWQLENSSVIKCL